MTVYHIIKSFTLSINNFISSYQEDWFEQLNVKAVMLMDAVDIYKAEIKAAKRTHPNDLNISRIERQINTVIHELMQSSKLTAETENEAEQTSESESEAALLRKNKEKDFINQYEHEKIDDDELNLVELIEYIHSSQGLRDYDAYSEQISIPSFSLGINICDPVVELCKEINREHENDEAHVDGEDVITPLPEKPQKRTRREAKLGVAYRSPYVRREIDLNAKYSTQDYAVWRWIIQTGKSKM